MQSLRWALCAVLVSPLALAAGRLSTKEDSIGEERVASSSPREVAVVLVSPHDPVPGGVGPLVAAQAPPRAAQLALARPAAPDSGVRGRRTTVTSRFAVYRIGRPGAVTSTSPADRGVPEAPPPTRPKPPPAPKPRPAPKPAPAAPPPAPTPPAPPVAVAPAPPEPAAPPLVPPPAEPAATPPNDGSTRPGNGYGDPNHEHTGPPGQAKKQ
jgi:hypothetical protein